MHRVGDDDATAMFLILIICVQGALTGLAPPLNKGAFVTGDRIERLVQLNKRVFEYETVTGDRMERLVQLNKRVFEYETVTGDRMERLVHGELRRRMQVVNGQPTPLLDTSMASVQALLALVAELRPPPAPAHPANGTAAAAAAAERQKRRFFGPVWQWFSKQVELLIATRPIPGLGVIGILGDTYIKNHPTFYDMNKEKKQVTDRLVNLQIGFVYEAKERVKVLDDIIDRNIHSFRFRMGFAWQKLEELRFQMRHIYSRVLYRAGGINVKEVVRYYLLTLRRYFDIVYMYERIYKMYEIYNKVKDRYTPKRTRTRA